MDNKDFELFAEENRQQLIDLNKGFGELKELLQKQLDSYEAPKSELKVNTEKSVEVNNLAQLVKAIQNLEKTSLEAIRANKPLKVDKVTVQNIKDAQTSSIEVSNLKELKDHIDHIAKAIAENKPIVEVIKQEVIFPTSAKNPISVRLSDGKAFYKALETAITAGGGVPTIKNADGLIGVPVLNPDGTIVGGLDTSIVVDTNNSTTTPLTAGATFTGIATDVLSYQQQGVSLFFRPNQIPSGDASTAKGSFFFEYSDDGTNWDISVPELIRSGIYIPNTPITVKRWFRVKYINDGGVAAIAALGLTDAAGTPTTQTEFRLTTLLYPLATKELVRSIDQNIQGGDPAALVVATGLGKQPDGDYVKEKADGTVFTTTNTLADSATYTSNWFDSDGWRSIELYISASHASATDGIQIEYTRDAGAATPTASPGPKRTFTADDVTNGFAIFRFATAMDGFRVKYTNGGTTQSSFLLQCNVHVTNVELPQAGLEAVQSAVNNAIMTRGVVAAKNAAGTYGNIPRGDNGGLAVSIDALTGAPDFNQAAVTSTPGQIAATPLTGRKTIMFVAPTSNTKIIAIGKTNSITTTSNSCPLGPGAALPLEIDDTYNIWYAVAESGTQRVAWVELS